MRLPLAIFSAVVLVSHFAHGSFVNRDVVSGDDAETYGKGYRSVAYFVNWVCIPYATKESVYLHVFHRLSTVVATVLRISRLIVSPTFCIPLRMSDQKRARYTSLIRMRT